MNIHRCSTCFLECSFARNGPSFCQNAKKRRLVSWELCLLDCFPFINSSGGGFDQIVHCSQTEQRMGSEMLSYVGTQAKGPQQNVVSACVCVFKALHSQEAGGIALGSCSTWGATIGSPWRCRLGGLSARLISAFKTILYHNVGLRRDSRGLLNPQIRSTVNQLLCASGALPSKPERHPEYSPCFFSPAQALLLIILCVNSLEAVFRRQ